eukprot:CAMPEP_0198648090 /NCGR_PEP_ID=MMETSP1467-20131203/3240_1 /TAXON_ID=1462469 /ORGANISM="unid. sp., Strain CCMP2135" /LENGTH=94 /DNA_ID=CAMNT_0044383783 /DNA_START=134 /DNA_END=418 /DNA_ORIENTATION=-
MEPISGPAGFRLLLVMGLEVVTSWGIFGEHCEDAFSEHGLDFAGPGKNDGVVTKGAGVESEADVGAVDLPPLTGRTREFDAACVYAHGGDGDDV